MSQSVTQQTYDTKSQQKKSKLKIMKVTNKKVKLEFEQNGAGTVCVREMDYQSIENNMAVDCKISTLQ